MTRCLPAVLRLGILAVLLSLTANGKPRIIRSLAKSPDLTKAESTDSVHLRLWKACDTKEAAEIQIRLLPVVKDRDNGGVLVAVNKALYQFTSYNETPAGPGIFEFALPGRPVSRLNVNLTKMQDYTLLVRVQHSTVAAELINDIPADDRTPSFNAYNLLFDGKGDVRLTLGDTLMVHLNSIGGRVHTRGIKADYYPIVVNGTDGKGQPFHWNAETDLRKTYRSNLLICLDAYGRIRPQLIEDNPSAEGLDPQKP